MSQRIKHRRLTQLSIRKSNKEKSYINRRDAFTEGLTALCLAGTRNGIALSLGNSHAVLVERIKFSSQKCFDLIKLKKLNTEDKFVAPYYGRVFFESSFTAILARFDPIRIRYLEKIQQSPNFKLGSRNSAAIQWSGDVFSSKSKLSWDPPEGDQDKLIRSIFHGHSSHFYWDNTLIRLQDFIDKTPRPRSDWLIDVLGKEQPIEDLSGRARGIFSTLSKGVHHELLHACSLDEETIRNEITNAIQLVANLALLSNFSSVAIDSLNADDAVKQYYEVEHGIS